MHTQRPAPPETAQGFVLALACYSIWGFFPLYFHQLGQVPALEILLHRILWSAASLLPIALLMRRVPQIQRILRDRRTLLRLMLSTCLISANWFLFIWAVEHAMVLQSSLGYYINPLISILMGMLFLGEQLSRRQWFSVGLAAIGVLVLAISQGTAPWIALILACSFGSYGLVRKTTNAGAIEGLLIETLLICPLAIAGAFWLHMQGNAVFLQPDNSSATLLLIGGGVLTALPLALFGAAARRLRLATIGLMQYITPTLHFATAVFLFGEPFSQAHMVAFCCIWSALLIFSSRQIGHIWRRLKPRTTTP